MPVDTTGLAPLGVSPTPTIWTSIRVNYIQRVGTVATTVGPSAAWAITATSGSSNVGDYVDDIKPHRQWFN